jgi:hypothetical protein
MDIKLFRQYLASQQKIEITEGIMSRRPEPELPKLRATMHKGTGYTTDAGAKFHRAPEDIEVYVQKEKPTKWIIHFPDGTVGKGSSNGKYTFHDK